MKRTLQMFLLVLVLVFAFSACEITVAPTTDDTSTDEQTIEEEDKTEPVYRLSVVEYYNSEDSLQYYIELEYPGENTVVANQWNTNYTPKDDSDDYISRTVTYVCDSSGNLLSETELAPPSSENPRETEYNYTSGVLSSITQTYNKSTYFCRTCTVDSDTGNLTSLETMNTDWPQFNNNIGFRWEDGFLKTRSYNLVSDPKTLQYQNLSYDNDGNLTRLDYEGGISDGDYITYAIDENGNIETSTEYGSDGEMDFNNTYTWEEGESPIDFSQPIIEYLTEELSIFF